MQLSIIALLAAISTTVSAAPVDGGMSLANMDNVLVARTSYSDKVCCPGGKKNNCNPCDSKLLYACPSCSCN
jgi:hypothetical protein